MIFLNFIEPRKSIIPVLKYAFIGRVHHNVVVESDFGFYEVGIDVTVSRKHARILFEKGKCYIQDLGSRNGTRINGTLIDGWFPGKESVQKEVKMGSIVEFGMQTMLVITSKEVDSELESRVAVIELFGNYLEDALSTILEVDKERNKSEKFLEILKILNFKKTFQEFAMKTIGDLYEELKTPKLTKIEREKIPELMEILKLLKIGLDIEKSREIDLEKNRLKMKLIECLCSLALQYAKSGDGEKLIRCLGELRKHVEGELRKEVEYLYTNLELMIENDVKIEDEFVKRIKRLVEKIEIGLSP